MNEAAERVNVLLVDDQPNNLFALEAILGDLDLNLVKADSGPRALKHLLDQDFGVVLLDVQMPGLDGFETARLIRDREKSSDTPIIFITAISRSESNVFKGYELGAVDYIVKPFDPTILRSKVSVFAELFRRREAIKRQADELARLTNENELILKGIGDGVLGVDLEGRTTFMNPAGMRMLGRVATDGAGQDIHALVHPTLPGVVTCNVSDCRFYAAVHRHAEGAFESTFHRPDGTSFPAEICSSSMARPDGMQVGSVITFRDATQKRLALAAAETERRYREAEAQNRAKDNFLATLSHELRTPMTSILGWVQFLARGSTPEELAEARQSIESSARLQARLIDDMLDVSRIILGKFDVDLRPTRITDVVEAAVVMARPAASDRELQLVTEIDDRDAVVDADPPRLRQVIDNLLSNAIKFSSPGNSVELRIERPNGSVKISVTDHGAGIDPTFLPYVFDRLSQAEDAGNRSGLGLGLAIARHVVALHGGELTAYSEGLERGARFTVTLPVLRVPLPASERVDSSGTMISA